MGKGLPPFEKLVTYLRPFLAHLVGTDLSPRTIQKHVDNMWLLDGEIIRDLNELIRRGQLDAEVYPEWEEEE